MKDLLIEAIAEARQNLTVLADAQALHNEFEKMTEMLVHC